LLKRKPPFFLCCGGVLGVGLVEIVRKAYSFVIFNYDPGDQILSLASLAAHVAHGPSLALYAMSVCCDVSTPPALTRRSAFTNAGPRTMHGRLARSALSLLRPVSSIVNRQARSSNSRSSN
jgi:hypothetical protein